MIFWAISIFPYSPKQVGNKLQRKGQGFLQTLAGEKTPSSRKVIISRQRRLEILAVSLFFSISLIIRAWNLSLMAANPDELIYASRAIFILGANWAWPKSFMLDQPPLFSYILAAVTSMFGGSLETLRWVSVLAGSGTVVVVYFFTKSIFNRWAGLFSATVLALNGFAIEYSRLIYIESVAIFFITTCMFLFWEGLVKRNDTGIIVLSGVFLGLAFDTKYITLVLPFSILLFLLIYRKRMASGLGRKLVYFSISAFLFCLPVIGDLYIAQRNPFFWLLDSRFAHQNLLSSISQASRAGGTIISSGLEAFTAQFNHVSSIDPFQAFPLYGVELILWTILLSATLLYFAASFLLRRQPRDGFLLILFLGLFAFAVLYPAKRYYFYLYPVIPLTIMLGGFASFILSARRTVFQRFRMPKLRFVASIATLFVVALLASGLVLNAMAIPSMYKSGFGDWDEIYPIMNYVQQHESPNSTVATNLVMAWFYGNQFGVQAQFLPLQRPVYYYQLPPGQRVLDLPIKIGYPVVWVLSPVIIEQLNPQFIIISKIYYDSVPLGFQQYITQHYYQPLSVKLILLFQLDNSSPMNQNASSVGG